MKNRILRVFVCLLLIVCLIVNISPIRVQATAEVVGIVALGVGIAVAVAAGMQALGVSAGTESSVFMSLVNDCADALSSTWAVDCLVTMLSVTSGSFTRTYASENFLQAILDWLFDSGTISYVSSDFIESCGGGLSKALDYVAGFEYAFYSFADADYRFVCSHYKPSVSINSTVGGYDIIGSSVVIITGSYTSANYSEEIRNIGWISTLGIYRDGEYFATLSDLTLESVGREIATDYESYVGTAYIDDNDMPWVPITIPSLGADYVAQTQAEAQAGTTSQEIIDELTKSLSDTETDSGTTTGTGAISQSWLGGILNTVISTLSDILQGVLSIPQAIAGAIADVIAAVKAIPSAITDFFTMDSTVESYAVPWSRFFPFCIPFDVRDLVLVLDAEPEAPHFEFDVDFPYMDEPWHIDIDFSCWDNVALVLRRLELLLFIVGLAMATRNFYIRG